MQQSAREDTTITLTVRPRRQGLKATRAGVALGLAQALGPWASADMDTERFGASHTRLDVHAPLGSGRFDMWLTYPSKGPARGALFIVPGLHPDAVRVPRMIKVSSQLAAAGIAVGVPALPQHLALRLDPRTLEDLPRAFERFLGVLDAPRGFRPGLMSISMGSLPALQLLASKHADALSGALLHGGCCHLEPMMRHLSSGDTPHRARPLLFINMVDRMPGAPAKKEPMCARWRDYISATWGHSELSLDERRALAETLAEDLPEDQREFFLCGCGARPGGAALCHDAIDLVLERRSYAFLYPEPHLSRIRAPITLLHGRNDIVILPEHSETLADLLREHTTTELILTGVYGHTKPDWRSRSGASAMTQEIAAMLRVVRAMTRITTGFGGRRG